MGIPYINAIDGSFCVQGTGITTPGIIMDNLGVMTGFPAQQSFSLTNGVQSVFGVSGNTFTSVGTRTFDPSILFAGNAKITRTLQFKALCQVTPGVTMQIVVYNTTDGIQVAPTLLSTTSSTLVELSATLALTTDIPNSLKTYDVEIKTVTPSPAGNTDMSICKSAEFVVRWA